MMDKYKEVITTKYIASSQSVITDVYRDLEGDWQFMGKEIVTEADAVILSLAQIFNLDNTIQEVLNIAPGYSAHRDNKTDNWKIQKDE